MSRCADDETIIGALLVCGDDSTVLVDDPTKPGKKAAQCHGGDAPTDPGTLVCAK